MWWQYKQYWFRMSTLLYHQIASLGDCERVKFAVQAQDMRVADCNCMIILVSQNFHMLRREMPLLNFPSNALCLEVCKFLNQHQSHHSSGTWQRKIINGIIIRSKTHYNNYTDDWPIASSLAPNSCRVLASPGYSKAGCQQSIITVLRLTCGWHFVYL